MAIQRNIIVRVGADVSQLQRSLQKAQASMKDFGKAMTGIGTKMSAAITLPIIGFGAAALKAGMDFEQGMSNIKALGGSTGEELKKLQLLALKMGKDTKFSAVEAAQGIEELAKAGVSTEQILNGGLKGALSLAAAGNIELSEAAEIASTALNAFRADNLNVIKAADILAGAANASATEVSELKMGLSQVSAVAAGVGMSFNDTATALAVFAQNGLKSSDAGTSLKSMLLYLQPSTDKAAEQFEKFGLINKKGQNIFYTTEGKLKGLADIAGILKLKLGKLKDSQRQQTLQTMFGTDAIRASTILFKEGAEGVSRMKYAMGKVTSEEVATEKMNNFKGSLENLRGTLETIGVSLYMLQSGPLKSFIDNLTLLGNKFLELSPSTQQFILLALGIAAAIGPLVLIIGQMSVGLSALAGVMGVILSPIGLVVLAIAAIGIALTVLYFKNDEFRAQILNIWNVIWLGLVTVWGSLSAMAMIVFGALQTFWENHGTAILSALTTAWNVIWSIISPIWDAISSAAVTVFSYIQGFFTTWGPTIQGIFSNTFELIWLVVKAVFDRLKAFWEVWGPLISAIFKLAFDNLKTIFSAAWEILKIVIETAIGVISNLIKFWLAVLKGDWSGAWGIIKDNLKLVWDAIGKVIKVGIDFVSGMFENLKTNLGAIWNGIWNVISTIVDKIAAKIKIVTDAVKAVGGIVGNVAGAIGGGVGDLIGKIPGFATGGIVTKPMLANVGEAGPEAIIPLSKLSSIGSSNQTNVQVILDGRVIQEYMDNKLGSRLIGLGAI